MITGYELVKLFSEKKDKKEEKSKERKVLRKLSDGSARGYVRSYLVGGLPGIAGTFAGQKEATQADREGKDVEEIKDRATKRGAILGAATGLGIGSVRGASIARSLKAQGYGDRGLAVLAPSIVGGAILGAAGGAWGANKNTRTRLEDKRNKDKKD